MIRESDATYHVGRLRLAFLTESTDPEALDRQARQVILITQTLIKYAVSDDHARRIVQQILETSEYWPTVKKIIDVAEETSFQEKPAVPDERCACGGSGYLSYWVLITTDVIDGKPKHRKELIETEEIARQLARVVERHQQVTQASDACTCALGQSIRAAASVRQQQPALSRISKVDLSLYQAKIDALPRKPLPFRQPPKKGGSSL